MRIKTFLVLLVVVAVVVAEVNAAKQQKGGEKGGKNGKKGGKYDKNQEKYGKQGKEQKGKYAKEVKKEEVPVEEEPVAQEEVIEEKVSKKAEKTAKKSKRSVAEEQVQEEVVPQKEKASKKSKKVAEEEPACNCPPGPPGPEGPAGPKGECVYQPVCPEAEAGDCKTTPTVFVTESTNVIALHSQTTALPECPLGQNQLWSGFSLLQSDVHGQAIKSNLGGPESCISQFTLSLTTSCSIEGQCSDAHRNDRSYWLVANNTLGTEPLLEADATQVISRCVVCDIAGPIVAIHSQSVEVPTCPSGWDALWNGYSYLASATTSGNNGGSNQLLSGPGSCLREARKPLFVECNPLKGSCNVFQGQSDSWLRAVAGSDVSRCAVCVKVA